MNASSRATAFSSAPTFLGSARLWAMLPRRSALCIIGVHALQCASHPHWKRRSSGSSPRSDEGDPHQHCIAAISLPLGVEAVPFGHYAMNPWPILDRQGPRGKKAGRQLPISA